MKKLIAKIKQCWINRPIYKTLKSVPDSPLFLLFWSSLFIAFYPAYVLQQVWPLYIEAVNSAGFTFTGIIVTLIMFALALLVWFFGCLAKKTGGLLYGRLFK